MSKRSDAFQDRLCHVDGQRPNARDRWTAFYRLYRLADRQGVYQDMALREAIMVLFPWRWTKGLDRDVSEGLVDRSHIPKFLRRELIENYRKRRLRKFGGNAVRDKNVARKVRETHGIEVTPDEVAETRYKLMTMARAKAQEMGVRPPENIDELSAILRGESR